MTMTYTYDLMTVSYVGSDGTEREARFQGRVLGFATSEDNRHTHPDDRVAAAGERCSACRWFEITLYETDPELSDDARYLVFTRGATVVPGEQHFDKLTWVESPLEIIEVLTVRQDGKPSIPKPSGRALAQAADRNDEVRRAYLERRGE